MARRHTSGAPDPIDVALGARVLRRRRQLGLSQSALANAVGVTFQQVQKYERGVNRIAASMLVRVAAALQTTVAALVGEDDTGPVSPVVPTQMATDSASELLTAFAAVTDGDARRALVEVTQQLARSAAKPPRRPKVTA